MKFTFEEIIEKVANNKTLSRKEKLNAIRVFLKEHSGPNKPTEEKDIEALAKIKAIKQTYTQQEANEKIRDRNP